MLTSNRALLGLEQESITIRFSIIDASPLVQLSNIHWFFIAGVGGSEMDITEEDMLGETALTFSDSRLELSLSGVTQDAAGIYRLVATNPAGITSNYTNITIQGKCSLMKFGVTSLLNRCIYSFICMLTYHSKVYTYCINTAMIEWV